jgi:small-conductance mechanosensitive channel
MKTKRKIFAIILLVLLGTVAYGLLRTSAPAGSGGLPGALKKLTGERATLVDQSSLRTAQELAKLADHPEEQSLSKEAIRLADHELDLAFDAALRDAELHPPVLSAEAKQFQARLEKAQKLEQADRALAESVTAAEAKASGAKKEALGDRLNEVKAQLESDEDEVDDATQDLTRAGGNAKARVAQMKQEHEDTSKEVDTAVQKYPAPPPEEFGLMHRYEQWSVLHQEQKLASQAKQTALAAAAALAAQHDALDARIEAAKKATPEIATHAKNAIAPSAAPQKDRNHEESAAALARMKEIVLDQKGLANFDKRADYEKQLAAVYGEWSDVVGARQRNVMHRALQGVLIVVVIAIIGLFFDTWLERLLGKTALDRRQVETLRTVTRVTVQVLAVLLILLVIFGPPRQLGTILGLAGAGLTVALKDFIVGFLGWFVLMGRNGIRLGDWVEINGVTGEVVETGMFHTVLLETGNWTDSGHPTGRRVTFTNSFAIEGHYFNFSTSGQWLWDELQITIPPGRDPFPLVEAIQKKVLEATRESTKQAETEWQRAAGSRDLASISATPAINVRPGPAGIEVQVRYVTRANERYQLRNKLYQSAVELLGGRGVQVTTPETPETEPA